METHRRWIPPAVICLLLAMIVTSRPGAAPAAPVFPDMLHANAYARSISGYPDPNGDVGDYITEDIFDYLEGPLSAAISLNTGYSSAWLAAGPGSTNPLALLRGGAHAFGTDVAGGWANGASKWLDYIVLTRPGTVLLTFGIEGTMTQSGASAAGVTVYDGPGNVYAKLELYQADSDPDPEMECNGWKDITIKPVEGMHVFNGRVVLPVDVQGYVEEGIYSGQFELVLGVGAETNFWGSASVDVGDTVTLLSATYADNGLPVGPEGHFDSGLPMPSATAVPEPSTAIVWSLLGVLGLVGARRRRPRQKA